MVPLACSGPRSVAADRRGFGRSGRPAGSYGYDVLANDLSVLLEALDLRHVTLVGFPMGGGEVVRIPARHGGACVSRAVLVARGPQTIPTAWTEACSTAWSSSFRPTICIPWQASARRSSAPACPARPCRPSSFSKTDPPAGLAAVRVPTLVIHGAADAAVPTEVSERPPRPRGHGRSRTGARRTACSMPRRMG